MKKSRLLENSWLAKLNEHNDWKQEERADLTLSNPRSSYRVMSAVFHVQSLDFKLSQSSARC